MKSLKYPYVVEVAGIRGKKNTWFGIVLPCHVGIVVCMYEWESARTNKTTWNKHEHVPHKRTRENGAIHFKCRRHRITSEELAMICTDCVSHSMLDQGGKLFMCDESVQ